jgi:hypothetical protein
MLSCGKMRFAVEGGEFVPPQISIQTGLGGLL